MSITPMITPRPLNWSGGRCTTSAPIAGALKSSSWPSGRAASIERTRGSLTSVESCVESTLPVAMPSANDSTVTPSASSSLRLPAKSISIDSRVVVSLASPSTSGAASRCVCSSGSSLRWLDDMLASFVRVPNKDCRCAGNVVEEVIAHSYERGLW